MWGSGVGFEVLGCGDEGKAESTPARKVDIRLPGPEWTGHSSRLLEILVGRCKATWKREFKLPWRKAGLLKSSR